MTASGPAVHNTNNITTFNLQKKAMPDKHTDPLFKTNRILRIQDVYEFQSILFRSKYETNTLSASFNLFTHNFDIHPNELTRQSSNVYFNNKMLKTSQIWDFQNCGINGSNFN